MINDDAIRYGTISRLFHWGMAFLIAWQLLRFFDRISEGEHWVGRSLVPWHVSIGSLLLLLVVLRIVWALTQKDRRPEQDPATAVLVRAGHLLLYAAMVLMPMTGAMTMVGKGYGWSPFGIELVAKGEKIPWMAALGSVHSPLAWLLLIMVAGHIGVALFHHFVKKDGVLRRMA